MRAQEPRKARPGASQGAPGSLARRAREVCDDVFDEEVSFKLLLRVGRPARRPPMMAMMSMIMMTMMRI